jgi:hypothetical protein
MYWARLKSSKELRSTGKDRGTLTRWRDACSRAPSTPKQESSMLTDCAVSRLLNEIRIQRKQQKRDLSLESYCDEVLDEIKTKVKGWIESLLEDILTDLVGTLGTTTSAFNDLTSSIYGNRFDFSSSAIIMPRSVCWILGPTGSALQTAMSAVVDVFQLIIGYLIYVVENHNLLMITFEISNGQKLQNSEAMRTKLEINIKSE